METNQAPLGQQVRQRLDQQCEASKNAITDLSLVQDGDSILPPKPTHSSPSSNWQPSSDWKSTWSWDSWHTSSWTVQYFCRIWSSLWSIISRSRSDSSPWWRRISRSIPQMRWTRTTRTARRNFWRSEKEACIATDAEDKVISQQDVERLSRRLVKERLDSREMAKARVKEWQKERWIGTCSAATAARSASAPGIVGPSSEMTPEEEEGEGAGLASVEDEVASSSTSGRWTRMRRTSGRRSFVDAHVRSVHGYRNPSRPPSKTSTWWMGMA